MRLLFLNSARTWGGNEKWTVMACEALSRDHEVTLAYRSPVVGGRFNGPRLRLPFVFELDPLTLIPLIVTILWKRIDIVIPTKRKDYVLAGLAARLCGRKNILRLGIVRTLRSRVQKWIYHDMADGIIVNAERIRQNLMRTPWMTGMPVGVIMNGLDTARFHQIDTDMCKPASFLVTSMGALIPRKGMDRLILGFAAFLSAIDDTECRLVIVGDGESRSDLEALIVRLNLQRNVFLVGHLDNPYPWIKASDVFVLASENEGLSNALAEAMFLKNAVVTTQAGGAAELIVHQENGLLTQPDPESIALALEKLYRHPDLRLTLAEAGFRTVTQKMSLDRMTQDIVRFCREILTQTGT